MKIYIKIYQEPIQIAEKIFNGFYTQIEIYPQLKKFQAWFRAEIRLIRPASGQIQGKIRVTRIQPDLSSLIFDSAWVYDDSREFLKWKVDSLDTWVISPGIYGSWCKRSTGSIPRRLLRELRVLIELPWDPGAKGRRIRYLDDFSGNLRC